MILPLGTLEQFSHHVTISLLIKRTARENLVGDSKLKYPTSLEAQLPEAPPLFAVHGECKRPCLGEDVMSFIRPK